MSISSVGSTSNPSLNGGAQSAQALTTIQNSLQSLRSQANQDPNAQKALQAVQSAIQSGDVGGAQRALATLKRDLQGTATVPAATPTPLSSDNDGDADGSSGSSEGQAVGGLLNARA